jgi:simple sugar transport system permease protein
MHWSRSRHSTYLGRPTLDEFANFFTIDLLRATLRLAAPLLFAALGGLLSERAGIVNIALEGMMLIGAFAAAAGTLWLGDPYLGLAFGVLMAMLGGLVHAVWCVSLRGDQIVVGTAINLLGLGIPTFLTVQIWGMSGGTPQVERLPTVWNVSVLVPVAFLLVPVVHFFLFRTKPGLRVLASGEHPRAAESVGIDVVRYRYACVIASGALAGLGGALLSIGDLSAYQNDITQGRGFIALAAVIFGNWMPIPTMFATLLFGAAQAFRIQAQVRDLPVNDDLILALPYLLTLVAIAGFVRRSTPPAGLGKHATAE